MRTKKVKYNFYSPLQVEEGTYPPEFSGRSCKFCEKRIGCLAFEKKDFSAKWLDLAKCGCKYFKGKELSKRKEVQKMKSLKKFLDAKGISDKEKICICLYFSGFTQADAYAIAFRSKAKGNSLTVAASHFFSTWGVKDLCTTLARFVNAKGFKLPKKFEV